MKKFAILSIILLSIGLICFANNDKFAESLRNCSYYSQTGNINNDGVDIHTTKEIIGWQNGKCTYKEKMKYSNFNITVTCKFTDAQIKELSSVIDAYSILQQYSDESSSKENNPIVKAWNKYLQNTSVCNFDYTPLN